VADRVPDRAVDPARVDGAEVDDRAQDVRARDAGAPLRCEAIAVGGAVDDHAVEGEIAATTDEHHVDRIAVRAGHAPQAGRRPVRCERLRTGGEHAGGDALLGSVGVPGRRPTSGWIWSMAPAAIARYQADRDRPDLSKVMMPWLARAHSSRSVSRTRGTVGAGGPIGVSRRRTSGSGRPGRRRTTRRAHTSGTSPRPGAPAGGPRTPAR
jgi:hypothetical protein